MNIFKRLIYCVVHKKRTLRVNILTLFLSLIFVSFVLVTAITYYKTSHSILNFSSGVIERTGTIIAERTKCLFHDIEQRAWISRSLFPDLGKISISDTNLVEYMLNVAKYDPNLTNFFVATKEGNILSAQDLTSSTQAHYLWTPGKPLPPEAQFAVRYINHTATPPTDMVYYMDENFATVATEEASTVGFDPRIRPWYTGAINTKNLYWTGVYEFLHSNGEMGMTASTSIVDDQGEIIGVLGIDLSFILLKRLVYDQKVWGSGKVLIVTKAGEHILPEENAKEWDEMTITKEVLVSALNRHNVDQSNNFLITKDGISYLVYIYPLPVSSELNEWLITVIVPINDFFGEMFETQRAVSLISIIILCCSALIIVYFARSISAPIITLSQEVDKIRHLELDSKADIKSNIKEINIMNSSIHALRLAMLSFARYVPKKVVKRLIDQEQEITLSGEKKELTVFFSDIESFSAIAEKYSVDVLMPLLAEYFDGLSKIALEYEGTIDKYIGDSLMVFWGAPTEIPQHAIRACTVALRCQDFVKKLNEKRKREGNPEFITRFGINTGMVIVGNIGTLERMNYTIIGDAVNTAARLQVVNKDYHTTIIISEEVYKRIGDQFVVRPLDVIQVKGKQAYIKIYELLATTQDSDPEILPKPGQVEMCEAFTQGYEAFHRGDRVSAIRIFETIHQKFPDDLPTQILLEKMRG